MPYSTELTEDCVGIIHAGEGVVTAEELLEACRLTTQLMENTENFHYEFIDFSKTSELKLTASDLEQVLEQDRYAALFRPDAVVVIVAPGDAIHQVALKWETRVQNLGWKTHISRDRAEAIAWLRANYPTPKPPRERETEETVSDSTAKS